MNATSPPGVSSSLAPAHAAGTRLADFFARTATLERSAHASNEDRVVAPEVVFARALVAQRLLPALHADWERIDPPHFALIWTTNAGKSTVANLLLGARVADMDARAGFTQHPSAYVPAAVSRRWLEAFPERFAGYDRYENSHPPRRTPAELEREGYRPAIAVVAVPETGGSVVLPPAAPGVVIWDSPDFSTVQAQRHWFSAVLDAAALADALWLCVTPESYADDRGHVVWGMIASAHAASLIVANKTAAQSVVLDDVEKLFARSAAESDASFSPAQVLRLPLVAGTSPEDNLERLFATPEAQQLRLRAASLMARPAELKRASVRRGVDWIEDRWDSLVAPLRRELDLVAGWRREVEKLGRERLLEAWRTEYLQGQRYVEFNAAVAQLLEMIQVPAVARTMQVIQTPFRWISTRIGEAATNWWSGGKHRPPEEECLETRIRDWYDETRRQAQERAARKDSPLWGALVARLDRDDERKRLLDGFWSGFADYRSEVGDEVRRRARTLNEELEKDPVKLNVMRGLKLTLDLAVVGWAVAQGGLSLWDVLIAPAVAAGYNEATLLALQGVALREKAGLQQFQFEAMRRLVERTLVQPLGGWLGAAVTATELAAAEDDWREFRKGLEIALATSETPAAS